jgi:hypothetical protein
VSEVKKTSIKLLRLFMSWEKNVLYELEQM